MQIIRDFRRFAPTFLKILTKSTQLSQFRFNEHQVRLYELILEQELAGKPVRIIVLKARQMGVSTFAAGYLYFKCATYRFTNGLVVAHDMASSKKIFEITKRFWDFSPSDGRPMRRYSNARELVFASPDGKQRNGNPGLISSLSVQSAGNTTAGRSMTIHHAHLSELAFWENAKETLTGLFQSIPVAKGTSIIIESTANGITSDGEVFYNMCQDAMNGKSDFKFFFLPWYEGQEYTMSADFDYQDTDSYERSLMKKGVSLGQIAWRRYKIRTDFGGEIDRFRQEFPATADESFISSGRSVLPVELVRQLLEKLENEAYEQGEIVN